MTSDNRQQTTTGHRLPARVRDLLAQVLEQDVAYVRELPDDTALFGGGLSLDSLTGLELLTAIEQDFGVDIAAEDLSLDSLETIGTLVAYLSSKGHSDRSQSKR